MRPPGRICFEKTNDAGKITPANFLSGFIAIAEQKNPKKIEQWLIANARHMREDMFFVPNNVWSCENYQILTLRAFAPKGVFTGMAKEGFLSQAGDNAELIDLAEVLFCEDGDLISSLPKHLTALGDHLTACMDKAYRCGIRKSDSKIA